jgi:hypothetical protein
MNFASERSCSRLRDSPLVTINCSEGEKTKGGERRRKGQKRKEEEWRREDKTRQIKTRHGWSSLV